MTAVPSAGEEAQSFAERIAGDIAAFGSPVHSLVVSLETRAFAPSEDSPHEPVRVWLDAPADLTFFSGAPADRSVSFSLGHSLFRASAQDGGDYSVLHELNGPSLEQALKEWERQLGPITQVEGVADVRRYGFAAPEDDGGPAV